MILDTNLIARAYTNSQQAADELQKLFLKPVATHQKLVAILENLRAANAAVQSLERTAAGAPTPKMG